MSFEQFILTYEFAIRLTFFFSVLVIIGLWELNAPRRMLITSKTLRWVNNLGLVMLNTIILRLIFPLAGVGLAGFCVEKGWGLFNYFQTPFLPALLCSVLFLDFVIWLQHVMFHAIPALWRLHRVHHADPDYDVTTGARFHPIEIVLSMLIKFAAIVVLGPPVVAVIIFEVILNAVAMFNHGNLKLPSRIDRVLRWFVVTPDMHRVHHSIEDDECNSNFGFSSPWWDRLFGTYREQPRSGHIGMIIGLNGFRDPHQVSHLKGMLLLPFQGDISEYVINRRNYSPGIK